MQALIQWPRAKYWDKAWNPIIGCKPCSAACEHCYAKAMAERFHKSFAPHASSHERPPRSGVVFCGNMTDLFGEWVPIKANFRMLSAMWHHPKPHDGPVPLPATYLWLTKRVDRMCEALSNYTHCPNAYFGFTAERQDWYAARFAEWMKSPETANGWISAEPLLGPLKLHLAEYPYSSKHNIKWLVVGCESGPNRRPCKIKWVEDIVEQCRAFQIPVFVKQLDINGRCVTDIDKFPKHLRIRQVPWATKGNDHA